MIKINMLVHQPSKGQQMNHHPILVKLSMQLLEVLVFLLHCPVELAVCQLHRVQGAHTDLDGQY